MRNREQGEETASLSAARGVHIGRSGATVGAVKQKGGGSFSIEGSSGTHAEISASSSAAAIAAAVDTSSAAAAAASAAGI